ncbi:hypothetical protein SAMN04488505_10350 [Chitinophaga rupis]|uniref:Uncharacterized protein n=1 Tax=Chitinophaga rupis TaxID=573321 RepID=A0A1H7UMC4_9BACT|nr:hypothetical protein SAMN04488505_10350 [Chitinophaga rupis]
MWKSGGVFAVPGLISLIFGIEISFYKPVFRSFFQ